MRGRSRGVIATSSSPSSSPSPWLLDPSHSLSARRIPSRIELLSKHLLLHWSVKLLLELLPPPPEQPLSLPNVPVLTRNVPLLLSSMAFAITAASSSKSLISSRKSHLAKTLVEQLLSREVMSVPIKVAHEVLVPLSRDLAEEKIENLLFVMVCP